VKRDQRGIVPTLIAPHVLAVPVTLGPPGVDDLLALREIRARNTAWLGEWESSDPERQGRPAATLPALARSRAGTWAQLLRTRLQARHGGALTWVVRYGWRITGEVTVFDITMGAARSAKVGYWVDQAHAGLGITSTAVALAADHCFGAMGLHRIEACIRPENAPSRRLAEKLGFREEGVSRRSVHVAGAWRDHIRYAAVVEDFPAGMLAQWRACANRK
jgi:ribosomal-protein-alanine N-acetyltransferase